MQSEKKQKREHGIKSVILIAFVGCLIYALNNGVRVNYGLISSAIENATGFDTAAISFAIALAQLFYGVAQPVFGALALKRITQQSNKHVSRFMVLDLRNAQEKTTCLF